MVSRTVDKKVLNVGNKGEVGSDQMRIGREG